MKILVLFSGTHSIEKVYNEEEHDIRSLDFDKTFEPYYNVDILTWDYITQFVHWVPDYIHCSPVCKHFSNLKNKNAKIKQNEELGFKLMNKAIEIIEYIKVINPKLKFTIENPKKNITLKYPPLMKYKHLITSYCRYDFPYQKDTTFWFGGFELKLKDRCNRKIRCNGKVENKNYHKVMLGYKPTHKEQIQDWQYFKQFTIKTGKERKDTYLRYRIPEKLCESIRDCVLS